VAGDPFPSAPAEILRLSASEADRLLGRLEELVPQRPPYVGLPQAPGASAFVFGDTHGDWRSTLEVVRAFEAGAPGSVLVGLGDYVDRAPSDLPCGSVANALYLLGLAAKLPERVFLLQGNHETTGRIGVAPHTLPREVERLWGREPQRYERLVGLLERGPVAASAACGAYLAHAGFPRGELPSPWTDALRTVDDERLLELVWSECDASGNRRGAIPPWGEPELERFLRSSGLSTVWRGHDPDVAGRPLYHDRAMTLHTTQVYERYAGIFFVELPLDRPLRTVTEVPLHHLSTERPRGSPRDGAGSRAT
jgi:Calcineurin-like phosphoesterase